MTLPLVARLLCNLGDVAHGRAYAVRTQSEWLDPPNAWAMCLCPPGILQRYCGRAQLGALLPLGMSLPRIYAQKQEEMRKVTNEEGAGASAVMAALHWDMFLWEDAATLAGAISKDPPLEYVDLVASVLAPLAPDFRQWMSMSSSIATFLNEQADSQQLTACLVELERMSPSARPIRVNDWASGRQSLPKVGWKKIKMASQGVSIAKAMQSAKISDPPGG